MCPKLNFKFGRFIEERQTNVSFTVQIKKLNLREFYEHRLTVDLKTLLSRSQTLIFLIAVDKIGGHHVDALPFTQCKTNMFVIQ